MVRIVGWMMFAAAACSSTAQAADLAESFRERVLPVLAARCGQCHGETNPEAKLNLAASRSGEELQAEFARWHLVLQRIEDGSMPPKGETPPTPAERSAITEWIRGPLTLTAAARQRHEGRTKLRRLSRNEYADTIRDLFGFRPAVGRELPMDGRIDGYDKVSAALPFSSSGAEGYVKLAEQIVQRLLLPPPKEGRRTFMLYAGPSEQSKGHILELPDGTMVSFNTDLTSGPLRAKNPEGKLVGGTGIRVPGTHKLRISMYGYQTDKPLLVGIYAGATGSYPQIVDLVALVEAPPGKPGIVETEVYFRTSLDSDRGVNDNFRLVPFGLGVQVPKNSQASECKGPGLAVQWVEVQEPEQPLPGDRWLTADMTPEFRTVLNQPRSTLKSSKLSREQIEATLGKTFRRLAAQLYRRDPTDAEFSQMMSEVMTKIDAQTPLRTVILDQVTALLTSPDFLCVIEEPGRLNDFALATRLSLFLWNAVPDERLLEAARQGRLSDPQQLRAETERLLTDPRSQRFVESFLDQWLGLWGIDNTTPDKDLYPEYDDELKLASLQETRGTFRRMLDRNLSVRDFVAPQWALVNGRLAAHYRWPSVAGFELRETAVPDGTPFGGIWTQAATMKVTANGTLTSPVKRGVWVAERLLGTPIPPPPPNIEPVDPDTRGAKTLREQLALHSKEGSCKGCHAKFDPYGFALESFDVMGGYRTKYRELDPEYTNLSAAEKKKRSPVREGLPVDCTGTTPDGTPFTDVRDLRRLLAEHPDWLARGVARHLLTYATGAPTTPLDEPAVDAVVAAAAAADFGLRSIIHGVVQSDPFRHK
jgi:hypothetical protein